MRSITNEELLVISGGDQELEGSEYCEDDEEFSFNDFDSPDGGKRKKEPKGGGFTNQIKEKTQEELAGRISEYVVEKGIELLGKGLDALGELGKEMLDVAAKQPPVNPGQRSGRE